MEWKNSEFLGGGEKRGGKIYIKALQKLLEEENTFNPGPYAAL